MADTEKNGRFRLDSSTVVQLVVWAITLALVYAGLDKRLTVVEGLDRRISVLESIERRITTLEVKGDQATLDLIEIKADLKRLLSRP